MVGELPADRVSHIAIPGTPVASVQQRASDASATIGPPPSTILSNALDHEEPDKLSSTIPVAQSTPRLDGLKIVDRSQWLQARNTAFEHLRAIGYQVGVKGLKAAEALQWAVTTGNYVATEVLLEAGVDANTTTPNGLTALHWASQTGNAAIAERLLRSGGNPNAKDEAYHRTPLHIASILGNDTLVELLLANGADITIKNVDGRTALHEAVFRGSEAAVSRLLSCGSDLEVRDNKGQTALSLALNNEKYGMARYLTKKGANVNAQDASGAAFIHVATRLRQQDIIELVLERGADIELKDGNGQTPLILAALTADGDLVHFLLERGADVNTTSSKGETALVVASRERYIDVIRTLLTAITLPKAAATISSISARFPDIVATPSGAHDPLGADSTLPARESPHHAPSNPLTTFSPRPNDGPSNESATKGWGDHGENSSIPPKTDIPKAMINIDLGFGLRASIVHFTPGEVYPRASLRPTVHELLCGPGPGALMAQRDDSKNRKFRWIHLPANNMLWVQELVRRVYREKTYSDKDDIRPDLLLRPDLWSGQQHQPHTNKLHARFMRPFFSGIDVDPHFNPLNEGQNSFVLYMPYLGWEYSGAQALTNDIVSDVVRKKIKVPDDQSPELVSQIADSVADPDEKLLRTYLVGELPMHIRRTLDQSYYHTLQSTEARDKDQVVYRYTEKVLGVRNPLLMMVDQLWLWVIDGDTLVTSFPQRWGLSHEQDLRSDESDVFECIMRVLNNGIKLPERMMSVYDMAALVAEQCSEVFFDRAAITDNRLQFADFFSNAIGTVTSEQTECFENFWKNFAHIETSQIIEFRQQDTILRHSEVAVTEEQGFESASYQLFDIRKETALLREIKDILDELNMICHVFKQQLEALQPFERKMNGERDGIDDFTDSSDRKFYKSQRLSIFSRTTRILFNVKQHLSDMKELEGEALRTYRSICDLLDLKQKQANVQEARSARKIAEQSATQAEEAAKLTIESVKQGRTIMLFTVVTIVMLPLSFFTSLFGMNAVEINGGTNGSNIPLATVFAYMFPISFAIIIFALILAFHGKSRNFYILQIRFIGYYFTKWTGLRWIAQQVVPKVKEIEDYQAEKLKHV